MAALELCDRAAQFIAERRVVDEGELLAHVYGGTTPVALRARLAEPLLADPRLERRADGSWALRGSRADDDQAFTALCLVATGPNPARASVVDIAALHVEGGTAVGRFSALVNPGRRVPRYVLTRLGLEFDVLDSQPAFADIFEELTQFLADRPLLAQDAHLTWSFLDAESRRVGRVLPQPRLLDVNELATRALDLKRKPTLSLVAAQLGIGSLRIGRPDEEARVLVEVASRLLGQGKLQAADAASTALRRGATARGMPDEPGVYVLRDRDQAALYVGKAKRLRSRMAAYINRPLGPTRHLEGLVAAVHAVETTRCASDLEALILEDREIRRLQPRFNTVRQQRQVRYWIRLSNRGLHLSGGPLVADGEFVGPFRNEMLADQARTLARRVFELDTLRRSNASLYEERLSKAWAFLLGETAAAEALARQHPLGELRQVIHFDVRAALLPADPRHARYAVVRRGPNTIEGFLLDRAILQAWTTLDDEDARLFAERLLAQGEPRTAPEDAEIVLRWFGAQRAPARLVLVPNAPQAALDAIQDAVVALTSGEA